MAVPLPAPNCGKATFHMHSNSKPWSTSFHFRYSGTWLKADQDSIASEFQASWAAQLVPQLCVLSGLTFTEVIDLADPTHASSVDSTATAGGISGSPVPVNNTMQVYWPVASRIRGGRSSSFLTGFSLADIQTAAVDMWSTTRVAAVQTAIDNFKATINSFTTPTMGTLQLGVVHYHRAHAVLTPPIFEAFIGDDVREEVHGRTRRLGRM